jgi:hypothetical protein
MAMNNGETNTRDERVVGAYRAASDALDERPRADTRAAILAAAARAVDAQPQDAETGATSRRTARRLHDSNNLIGPSKRPLALVASFLVATVALVLATQTREEIETKQAALERGVLAAKVDETLPQKSQRAVRTLEQDLDVKREANGPTMSIAAADAALNDKADTATPVSRAEERLLQKSVIPSAKPPMRDGTQMPATPPVPAAAPAPAAPSAQAAPPVMGAAPAQPAAPALSPAPAAEAVPPQRQRSLSNSVETTARVARNEAADSIESTRAQGQAATSGVASMRPPAAAAEQRAKETQEPQKLKLRADRTLDAQPEAAAGGRLAKARPVERTAALSGDSVENDPARWMERIIALRDRGQDEEADRELARLRERFPDVTVPPNALRRTGTR